MWIVQKVSLYERIKGDLCYVCMSQMFYDKQVLLWKNNVVHISSLNKTAKSEEERKMERIWRYYYTLWTPMQM